VKPGDHMLSRIDVKGAEIKINLRFSIPHSCTAEKVDKNSQKCDKIKFVTTNLC
jgi:hypothetical protein